MLKAVMAGASVTMIASEFLQKGMGRAPEILADMEPGWKSTNMTPSSR